MSREAHVRFWEGVGVRLPRATRLLILGEDHLRRVLNEYVSDYFNTARPHQGIGQRIPREENAQRDASSTGEILARPILGGLHHDYKRAA